jgi:rhamnosyltransferase
MTMGASEGQPRVSVVLLTKNGIQTIGRCLESLFKQEPGFTFEVIVIDSGSTDGTIETLSRYPVNLRRIPPEDFNFGATKNLGFSISQGQIVVFLSQDAIPLGNDWLRKMTAPFEDPGVMVVQGAEVSGEDGFYWWRKGFFWYTAEIRRWMGRYNEIGLSCVTIAIRKKAWENLKFETVPFGEDKLFQKKAVEAGLGIVLAKNALVEHTHRFTLRSLFRRVKNEGLGARISGEEYSLRDLARDVVNLQALGLLDQGLRDGEIRTLGELLYPIIRPIGIYVGWKSAKQVH